MGEGEGEEAEYAWLQADSLKPFTAGDSTGNPDGVLSGDATLQACVAAAKRALQVISPDCILRAIAWSQNVWAFLLEAVCMFMAHPGSYLIDLK